MFLGANLIPEGLETGEYKIDASGELSDMDPVTVFVYSGETINDPTGQPDVWYKTINQGGYSINGIPQTVAFIIATSGIERNRLIEYLSFSSNSSYLVACFTVPKFCIKSFMTAENSLLQNGTANDGVYLLCSAQNLSTSFNQAPVTKTLTARPSSIDGYTPRNKKLLQYPYLYVGYNPQNGNEKVFRYEDFTNGTPSFNIISEVNPNPTICLIPQNYRGNSNNVADAVFMNGYPSVSSRVDTFNVWLAQNSNIINLQVAQESVNYLLDSGKSIANLGTNVLTENPSGAFEAGGGLLSNVINYEFYIANQMAQIEKQKMLPDKVSLGSSATLIGYDYQKKDIFDRYSIKSQFAQRIDSFVMANLL